MSTNETRTYAYIATCRECGGTVGVTSDELSLVELAVELLRDGCILSHVPITHIRSNLVWCTCRRDKEGDYTKKQT